jgi:antitoxin CptB
MGLSAGQDRGAVDSAAFGRLRWRCRRGMRELDELLTRYIDRHYASDSAPHQAAFRALLDAPDPLIYEYILGRRTAPDPAMSRLIERIIAGPANT